MTNQAKCSGCGASIKSSDPNAIEAFKATHRGHKKPKATAATTTTKKESPKDAELPAE
jgi:hypothetical protein